MQEGGQLHSTPQSLAGHEQSRVCACRRHRGRRLQQRPQGRRHPPLHRHHRRLLYKGSEAYASTRILTQWEGRWTHLYKHTQTRSHTNDSLFLHTLARRSPTPRWRALPVRTRGAVAGSEAASSARAFLASMVAAVRTSRRSVAAAVPALTGGAARTPQGQLTAGHFATRSARRGTGTHRRAFQRTRRTVGLRVHAAAGVGAGALHRPRPWAVAAVAACQRPGLPSAHTG
jgi:hypothetical protein